MSQKTLFEHAGGAAGLHPLRKVPIWTWNGDENEA
jgi:hypothetical protein